MTIEDMREIADHYKQDGAKEADTNTALIAEQMIDAGLQGYALRSDVSAMIDAALAEDGKGIEKIMDARHKAAQEMVTKAFVDFESNNENAVREICREEISKLPSAELIKEMLAAMKENTELRKEQAAMIGQPSVSSAWVNTPEGDAILTTSKDEPAMGRKRRELMDELFEKNEQLSAEKTLRRAAEAKASDYLERLTKKMGEKMEAKEIAQYVISVNSQNANERDEWKARAAELEKERDALRDQINAAIDRGCAKTGIEVERDYFKAKLAEERAELAEANEALKKNIPLLARLPVAEIEIKQLKSQLADFCNRGESEVAERDKRIRELEKELVEARKVGDEETDADARVYFCKKDMDKLRDQNAQLSLAMLNLTADRDSLRQQLAAVEKERDAFKKAADDLAEKFSVAERDMDTMKTSRNFFQGHAERLLEDKNALIKSESTLKAALAAMTERAERAEKELALSHDAYQKMFTLAEKQEKEIERLRKDVYDLQCEREDKEAGFVKERKPYSPPAPDTNVAFAEGEPSAFTPPSELTPAPAGEKKAHNMPCQGTYGKLPDRKPAEPEARPATAARRMMKANEALAGDPKYWRAYHGVEHLEHAGCKDYPPCEPVEAKPASDPGKGAIRWMFAFDGVHNHGGLHPFVQDMARGDCVRNGCEDATRATLEGAMIKGSRVQWEDGKTYPVHCEVGDDVIELWDEDGQEGGGIIVADKQDCQLVAPASKGKE